MASAKYMPAIAPALARLPAKTALPMKLRTMGAIGRKKPIAMQARQVKISKTAFAAILATPRLIWAARKLPYQSRAKATIAAAIRMARLLFALSLAPHSGRMRGAGAQIARIRASLGPRP